MTLIFDWLSREGGFLIIWWLLATAAGAAALPWCWRLLGGLPDKGYTLARPLGLMLVGFVYWFLGSVGLLQNTPGGIVLAWLIVLVVGVWIYRRGEPLPQGYWRETFSVRVVAEIVFLGLFVGWAIYRAHFPDTSSTEKPMELAFMSGILRSDNFPPNDPWLSGYAISYYYFGYVMSAMLTMISGVKVGIGFSLTISLWFGLIGVAAFGVGYNLVRSRVFRNGALWDDVTGRRGAIGAGVLAVVCVLFLSNFQFPLIEIPYQSRSMPAEYFEWWRTQERSDFNGSYIQSDNPPFTITDPSSWDSWWFFRASRVLNDIQLDGTLTSGWIQPIDEFPNFSFLLGDAHPHVLALPFVILCLGMALNLVLLPRNPNIGETLLYGLMVGCLIFLNTWDGPVYLSALVGAFMLRRIISQSGRLTWQDWAWTVGYGALLLIVGVLSVLPFLISFRSQAGGFLPNLITPTYFPHLFLMFGPFILLTGTFVLVEAWRGQRTGRMNWGFGLAVAVGLLIFLGLLLLLFVILASLIPSLQSSVQWFIDNNGGWDTMISRLIERRLAYGSTILLLLITVVLLVARLFPRSERKLQDDAVPQEPYAPATGFSLLLIGIAVMMILIPEFVYLRDNFGTRINTIFKFYYQAWVLLSIATAYGVWAVFAARSNETAPALVRIAYGGLVPVVLFLGLLYAPFGLYARGYVESGRAGSGDNAAPLKLDGTPGMTTPDDYAMVQCLAALVEGDDAVVAEAERDAYRSFYNRVGSITGIPTVIGWQNHERQWRGPTFDETAGGRAESLEAMYNAPEIEIARQTIDLYGIDYIVYGRAERQTYDVIGEEKFIENFPVVCEVGENRVYRVVPPLPGLQG